MKESVPSPCINVCKLDKDGTYCTGCLRTRNEIAIWSTATEEAKQAILDTLSNRKAWPR